jgi:hypothetical protein
MEVPREIAKTSLSPTGAWDEPGRLARDAWKAAGITIELSKRAQRVTTNPGWHSTVQYSNGKERNLQLRSTGIITL